MNFDFQQFGLILNDCTITKTSNLNEFNESVDRSCRANMLCFNSNPLA